MLRKPKRHERVSRNFDGQRMSAGGVVTVHSTLSIFVWRLMGAEHQRWLRCSQFEST